MWGDRYRQRVLWLALSVLAAGPGCSAKAPDASSSPRAESAGSWSSEPLQPLPLESDFDELEAELGELLFRSTLLSDDGKVACSSCHAADHGLAVATPLCDAPGRPTTPTNATTLFNVRYFYKLTWKGRFDTLDGHLDALIASPSIMAASWASVTARLRADQAWQARFHAVFGEDVSERNLRRALLEYERSLVTPNAPFDRFLRGDATAISAEAQRGYALFKQHGCVSCHQGAAVGANMRQVFGVMGDDFEPRLRAVEDRVFRVPSLRNVALTPPYLHDGSAPTLEAVVAVMGRQQLGRQLAADDVSKIVLFLKSLTGEYRGRPL
jgi:cytochrome c peroxidase